ncbi:hypothetical protein ACEWY4_017515 [Coilia grayii]|uniref:LITAF domain-containing protein n=1 Tax=Coilia grayii TaxID=363190 RepID=A0ABD1JH31_9TELE
MAKDKIPPPAYQPPAPQYPSGPPAPQYHSGPPVPQYPSGPPAPQYPSGPPAPQYPSGTYAPYPPTSLQHPAPQTTVVMATPAQSPMLMVSPTHQQALPDHVKISKGKLGGKPTRTTCSNCRQNMETRVIYERGCFAWTMCILLCCIGLFFGPCLIPLFMKKCKDAHHYCSMCNKKLCVHKRCC